MHYIDSHVHLFDKDGYLYEYNPPIPYNISHVVGFLDIEPKYINEYKDKCLNYYFSFINSEYYDDSQIILLATGVDAKEIISIHSAFPNVIKGFGELKCYDYNRDKSEKLPYKNIEWVSEIAEYSSTVGNLPIYIHYTINSEQSIADINNLCNKYPNIPFVLCHCGMDEFNLHTNYDRNQTYFAVLNLMKKHKNLWVDISYKAMDYFLDKPELIKNIDSSRLLIGSDINPALYEMSNIDEIKYIRNKYKALIYLNKYTNNINTKNICNLFKLNFLEH